MGALLPNDRSWLAANWVSRGFFEDARRFVARGSVLASDIQFCIDAELDTLDMREYTPALIAEVSSVVDSVIAFNLDQNGSSFQDPTAFPTYLSKLRELQTLVRDVVSTQSSA